MICPIAITDVENNKFALPPWKILMKYRVVVASCLDSGLLVAAQCTNTSLMRLEEEITSSLHSHRTVQPPISAHWTHLLIDEVYHAYITGWSLPDVSFVLRQRKVLNQNLISPYRWYWRIRLQFSFLSLYFVAIPSSVRDLKFVVFHGSLVYSRSYRFLWHGEDRRTW